MHETLVGLGAGFGALCLAWVVLKAIWNVRASYRRVRDTRDSD